MNYHLLVKFGEKVVPLDISNLRELTISQDINKVLPEFRLRVSDISGALTHVLPFDQGMSKVYIELGSRPDADYKNSWQFSVYNRAPSSFSSSPSAEYDISGMLEVPKLFSPDYSRAHKGKIKASLENVSSELQVDSSEVSSSLNYDMTLLQPKWSNMEFLKWSKENVIGNSEEYGYKCFIKCESMKKVFVFKNTEELLKQPIKYKFVVDQEGRGDNLPIFKYSIFDYYKLYGVFGSRKQTYCYFDYNTSEFVTEEENAQDYYSLSDYWLIDKDDTEDSDTIDKLGRNNSFTNDFKGYVKSKFSRKLMNLVKMWITTVGVSNAVPGSIVQVFFPQGVSSGNLYSYQYSGYWLVEKVVHNVGDSFMTKLLLTRNGLDTDKNTTLLQSINKKQ